MKDSHLLDPRRTPAFGSLRCISAPRGKTAPKILQDRKTRAYPAFGFFAPYFERACLRSFHACKSSEPRTMW